MRLKSRPDLLLKVEARLQALHQRRLKLEWGQSGIELSFSPTVGGARYFANVEASGLLQLVPLLACLYDDQISALLVDEPELSLHPQLQAYLMAEARKVAGDPTADASKKLVVYATHSPSMLPLRRITDIPQLIFFTDRQTKPKQLPVTAKVLENKKLSALISRLSENHKLAFFGKNVLLVEGPSDEILVHGVAHRLDHTILGSNTQVVPVTGKGSFPETIKFFRLLGKNTFVMADLDAFSDDNSLVNCFQVEAQSAVAKLGFGAVTDFDRAVKSDLQKFINDEWSLILPSAEKHHYWRFRKDESPEDELKAKRRAALAVLLSNLNVFPNGHPKAQDWRILAQRFNALLQALTEAGCVILRKGTIEDYFASEPPAGSGKPESAAVEADDLDRLTMAEFSARYTDVITAIRLAAPQQSVNENDLLREQLGSLWGAAMQIASPNVDDAELNSRIYANSASDQPIFEFSNKTVISSEGGFVRRVEITIKSALFQRDTFPVQVSETDNQAAVIRQLLP